MSSRTESALFWNVALLTEPLDLRPKMEDEIAAEAITRLRAHVDSLSLDDDALDLNVVRLLEEVVGIPGRSIRVKHVSDSKNLGNRISEGLGAATVALVLSTPDALLAAACERLSRQLDALPHPAIAVALGQDEDGHWSTNPLVVVQHQPAPTAVSNDPASPGQPSESTEDGSDPRWLLSAPSRQKSVVLARELTAEEDEAENESNTDVATNKPDFFDVGSAEEQAHLVWEQLLWEGSLTKEEAVRLAAPRLRDEGILDYGRLAKRGRVYQGVLTAIEAGVKEGCFDRPARGQVRAIVDSPDMYSPKDWALCLAEALPPGESIGREQAVRLTAQWAREVLGLEYSRIRSSGRIDTAVRNAMRTLIRRGHMDRDGRENVILRRDASMLPE